MTKEQILIAEYMGKKFIPYNDNHSYSNEFDTYNECFEFIKKHNLKNYQPEIGWPSERVGNYRTDWSHLMPVVEKIARHEYERDPMCTHVDTAYPRTFGMIDSETGQFMFRYNRSSLFQADTLIEACWLATVDFITRLNEGVYESKL